MASRRNSCIWFGFGGVVAVYLVRWFPTEASFIELFFLIVGAVGAAETGMRSFRMYWRAPRE